MNEFLDRKSTNLCEQGKVPVRGAAAQDFGKSVTMRALNERQLEAL